jgi:hypothetical protein
MKCSGVKFLPKLISSKTEEGSADRSEQQSKSDGGGDAGVGLLVVCRKLGSLDRQGVEVEGVSSPCKEADDEVQPILPSQLSEERKWVLERLRLLPLAVLLAIVVPDHNTLVPDEQVLEALFGGGEGALGQRVGGSVGACHCY